MKSREEIMFILEAFDLTRSYRDAAELAGCDHHTVAHYVGAREEGRLSAMAAPRSSIVDPYLDKIESGWSAPGARCAPTWPTTSWWRSATPARSAPVAGRWPR